jgi:16S rRNA (guanine966-N2)-methyltransferase
VVTTGQPVQAFLNSARDSWELVFMDPPYDLGLPELVHNLESLAKRLSPGAVVVLERSSRTPAPEWPAGIEFEKRKDYGDTALYWLTTAEP